MSDAITAEEQSMIVKFLKKRKPTRIPPGVSGHSGFKYDPEKNGLVLADPDKDGDGWRNSKKRGRRISPETAQRRMRVRDHMKALKSAPEIAKIEGVAVSVIRNDANVIGFSFADVRKKAQEAQRSQPKVKPKKPKPKTLAPTPKVRTVFGPPKSEAVAKRRAEIVELAKSGTTAPEMAEIYGVSRATIYVDLKEMGVKAPRVKRTVDPKKPRKNAGDKIAMKRQRGIDSSLKAVADRRRFKKAPVAIGTPSKLAPANAKRTIFESRVFEVADENILKDGSSNSKIGGDVLVGWLEGAGIYTLTLEERATCPSSCFHWRSCFAPETRVLTSDLKWIEISELHAGQEIVCFDEEKPQSGRRKFKPGTVLATRRVKSRRIKISTDKGEIVVTPDHLFLARRVHSSLAGRAGYQWLRADSLGPAQTIKYLTSPWDVDNSYDAARFRGFLEGEGSISCYDENGFNKVRLSYSQRPGNLSNQINEIALRLGYDFHHADKRMGVRDNRITFSDQRGGFRETMRLVGRIRPTRFIEKSEGIFDGQVIDGRCSETATVYGVSEVDHGDVFEIATSEKTLVAEGFLAHNCYGNAMQFARRWAHGQPLMDKIEAELPELLARHERILIRLHVLGDFWSVEYVDFWKRMLERHPGLHAFGFTAWKADTEIGDYVDAVAALHPRRFMIRHSDTTGKMGSFTLDFPTEMKTIGDAIVCPEQLDGMRGHPESRHCGNCGACWSTDRPIAFIIH